MTPTERRRTIWTVDAICSLAWGVVAASAIGSGDTVLAFLAVGVLTSGSVLACIANAL